MSTTATWSGTTSFMALAQPDADYLESTAKPPITDFYTPLVGDTSLSIAFTAPGGTWGGSWTTWGSIPSVEQNYVPLHVITPLDSATLTLSRPTTGFGFEILPQWHLWVTFSIKYFAGDTLIDSMAVTANGGGQARLVAVRSPDRPFDRIEVASGHTGYGDARDHRFAMANFRYQGPDGYLGFRTVTQPQQAHYTVWPAASNQPTGGHRYKFKVGVYQNSDLTGPIPNRTINGITLTALDGTGGHTHTGDKPKGRILTAGGTPIGNTVQTGATGEVELTYEAPEVAGTVQLKFKSPDEVVGITVDMFVKVPDLIPLPASTYYKKIGNCGGHVDCHYVHPGMALALDTLARMVFEKYSGEQLEFNDISGIHGGVLDIDLTIAPTHPWTRPHGEHRRGRNVDLRTWTLSEVQQRFVMAVWQTKYGEVLRERYPDGAVHDERDTTSPHLHLRW